MVGQGCLREEDPPLVSVVIVSFNSSACLAACLHSLSAQSYPCYEVIAVDNASSDRSLEVLQRFPWVKTLPRAQNLGFAGGCNLAVREARGRIVVLLNPDTIVEPDWLEELVRPLREDPTIGVTGSKILSTDGSTILAAGGWYDSRGLSHHYRAGETDDGPIEPLRDVPYVTGASLAVRRALWQALGGLDAGYFPAYFEELELCQRMRQRGLRVVYASRSRCRHLESQSVGAGSANYLYWYHRNRWRFVLKNISWRQLIFVALPQECHWFVKHYVLGFLWAARKLSRNVLRGACSELIPLVKAYCFTLEKLPSLLAGRRSYHLSSQPREGSRGEIHRHRRSRVHRMQSR